MPKFQILLVEDDPHTSAMVSEVLRGEGFEVCAAETAGAARSQFEKPSEFDLVVLDRSLPDADGIDLCAEMRRKSSLKAIPVLFLTAKGSVADKVEGLQTGGDDYLVKPFNPAELVARVQALLRRSGRMGKPASLESGPLRLDLEGRKAYVKGKAVELWAKEFDLLALLLSQKNRVMSREFLLQEIWGYAPDSDPATKVVDVTVSHLRAKLGAYGDRVVTVRGFGYRLDTD
jgi:DNA-binding response OmpR family regulator